MSSGYLETLLSTLKNLKMKTLSLRNFNLTGQCFLESSTEHWMHKFLVYIKGSMVKCILGTLGWIVKLFSLLQNLLAIFICQGALAISKDTFFSNQDKSL